MRTAAVWKIDFSYLFWFGLMFGVGIVAVLAAIAGLIWLAVWLLT